VAARESLKPRSLQVDVHASARNASPSAASRSAAAVAPVPTTVGGQRSPQQAARTASAGNNEHRRTAYTVPFDCWIPELDDVLAEFCKRGRDGEREAIVAIRQGYPHISVATIWARMLYLGLTRWKRRPYSHHDWSPEDLQLLGSGYSDGRNGASRTIDVLLERHPDWSRSVVSWKAKSLGFSRKRKGYQPWSENADRQLISCEGFQLESVEKRMKRTKGSIWSRLSVLDRGAEFFGGFKTKDLMELLHLDGPAIRRLKRRGLLRCERGRITEESVTSLCRDHSEEVPFETLSPETQHTLVEDYEYRRQKQAPKGGRKKTPATESTPEVVG
jgi:hypothetical protein